jgi:multidrug efflux pump subunit AcrA (membrane-fusion protein)
MSVQSATPSAVTPVNEHATSAHDVESMLAQIADLARQPRDRRGFEAELLDRTISLLAALGGAVWMRDRSGALAANVERLPADGESHQLEAARFDRQRSAEATFESGKSRVVLPDGGDNGTARAGNRSRALLLFCPIASIDDEPAAVLEVFQRADSPPPARAGYLHALEDICELAAEFYRRRELAELRERAELWGRFEQFTRRVHADLDRRRTAFTIVNESRLLIGCDRVTLLEYAGGRSRLLAVSGVDSPNDRSNTVHAAEALSDAILKTGEPFWLNGPVEDLAPQIESPLNRYLEESPARVLAVVPLDETARLPKKATEEERPGATIGALIAEKFDTDVDDQMASRIGAVCGQSALALQNALTHDSVGLLGFSRTAWRQNNRTTKLLAGCGVLAIVTAALCLIPADFDVAARGQTLPVERRDVFAPADGTVRLAKLPAGEQPFVKRDDLLAVLENRALEMRLKGVFGEIQTTESQLKAIQSARRFKPRNTDDAPPDGGRSLSAQEQELQEKLSSLKRQHATLQAERDALTVRSPIAGRIVTWDVVRRLESLPVNRGEVLMQVAQTDGPWELELRLSQRDAGHLLEADRRGIKDLHVTFAIRDEPGVSYRATVTQISESVQENKDGEPYVIVTAAIEDPDVKTLHPGATVTARIACGRRAVGYVWFHELIDTVRDWWAL